MEEFSIAGDDFYTGDCCIREISPETIDDLIVALNKVKELYAGSK
jgi:hypothetical protein